MYHVKVGPRRERAACGTCDWDWPNARSDRGKKKKTSANARCRAAARFHVKTTGHAVTVTITNKVEPDGKQ